MRAEERKKRGGGKSYQRKLRGKAGARGGRKKKYFSTRLSLGWTNCLTPTSEKGKGGEGLWVKEGWGGFGRNKRRFTILNISHCGIDAGPMTRKRGYKKQRVTRSPCGNVPLLGGAEGKEEELAHGKDGK